MKTLHWRRRRLATLVWALVWALVAALTLSGCDFSVYKMPLPGGADVGDDPITVTARFDDVLDLVPQSSVKVADVSVGKVTDIKVDDYQALVTMELNSGVELPNDTIANLRQTSLLGEKFVSLQAPPGGGTGRLKTGDIITETGRNPEVEEVLGALSLVLNGGGVAQLKSIATELNNALENREGSARSLLRQANRLMTQLDNNKTDIVDAIEALNRLSISVNKQRSSIDLALDNLPSALRSLNSQRGDLVKMLRSLTRLRSVGVRVIKTSKQATIDTLQNLVPILDKLTEAGDALPKSLQVLFTYPFVDEVVGRDPTVARNLHMGDYTNLSIKLDLKLPLPTTVPTSVEEACQTLDEALTNVPGLPDAGPIDGDALADALNDLTNLCAAAGQTVDDCVDALQTPDTSDDADACQRILTELPQEVVDRLSDALNENVVTPVCEATPNLPVCTSTTTDGGLLPGLGRPAPGAPGSPATSRIMERPTVRQLTEVYDPDLVSLMLPGMVTR